MECYAIQSEIILVKPEFGTSWLDHVIYDLGSLSHVDNIQICTIFVSSFSSQAP